MPEEILQKIRGSVHETIEVVQRGHLRYMRFGQDGGWQGAISAKNTSRPVFAYQRAFASLVHSLPELESFLALGVGSGTALQQVKQAHPGSIMYGLEMDEHVVDAAVHYFGAPSHNDVTYWIGDGVVMLCNTDICVDLLFVDAYLKDQAYGPCLHPDFPAVLRASTTQSGIAVCNLITSYPIHGVVQEFLDAGSRQFEAVYLLAVGPPIPFASQNILSLFVKDESVLDGWKDNMKGDRTLRLRERWSWPLRLRKYQPHGMI